MISSWIKEIIHSSERRRDYPGTQTVVLRPNLTRPNLCCIGPCANHCKPKMNLNLITFEIIICLYRPPLCFSNLRFSAWARWGKWALQFRSPCERRRRELRERERERERRRPQAASGSGSGARGLGAVSWKRSGIFWIFFAAPPRPKINSNLDFRWLCISSCGPC